MRAGPLLPFAALALLGAAVSQSTTVSALKDALRLATERAVATTARTNGFLDDPEIRIRLPGKLDSVAKGLRAVGQGAKVDELEVAMNRAAEKAAGEATPVFVDAIKQLNFEDAAGIVKGGDTAATEYFQAQTTDPLRARFRPIVDQAMKGVGVTKTYDQLLAQYKAAVPFASAPKLDLNGYVTDRTLAGLFSVVGEEEKKIRSDPSARATDLLKQVFGR